MPSAVTKPVVCECGPVVASKKAAHCDAACLKLPVRAQPRCLYGLNRRLQLLTCGHMRCQTQQQREQERERERAAGRRAGNPAGGCLGRCFQFHGPCLLPAPGEVASNGCAQALQAHLCSRVPGLPVLLSKAVPRGQLLRPLVGAIQAQFRRWRQAHSTTDQAPAGADHGRKGLEGTINLAQADHPGWSSAGPRCIAGKQGLHRAGRGRARGQNCADFSSRAEITFALNWRCRIGHNDGASAGCHCGGCPIGLLAGRRRGADRWLLGRAVSRHVTT